MILDIRIFVLLWACLLVGHSSARPLQIDMASPGNGVVVQRGRRLLQICTPNNFWDTVNQKCTACPTGTTSPGGSVTTCTCPVPSTLKTYYSLFGVMNSHTSMFSEVNSVFIFRNNIVFQGGTSLYDKPFTHWQVRTLKGCNIQPFVAVSQTADWSIPNIQNYEIVCVSEAVNISSAGTFFYEWKTVFGSADTCKTIGTFPIHFGWYSSSDSCISMTTSVPNQKVWATRSPLKPYSEKYNYSSNSIYNADVSIRLFTSTLTSGLPSVQLCTNCNENTYWDNGQCTSCPTNTNSSVGTASISGCISNIPTTTPPMTTSNIPTTTAAPICTPNQYMNNGVCTSCPSTSTSSAGSTSISNCTCMYGRILMDGVCKCNANYYWDLLGTACFKCPSGRTSLAGSTFLSQCICSSPNTLNTFSFIFGGEAFGSTMLPQTNSVFILQNAIIGGGEVSMYNIEFSAWRVRTRKGCSIQPFVAIGSVDSYYFPTKQTYSITCLNEAVNVPSDGLYDYFWKTVYSIPDGCKVSPSRPMYLGWYSSSDSCVDVDSFTPGNKIWITSRNTPDLWSASYNFDNGLTESRTAMIALMSRNLTGNPTRTLCIACQENTYWSNSACASCPANTVSQSGTASISGCVSIPPATTAPPIDVNLTVNGVNQNLSQSQFSGSLPSNVTVQTYSESNVITTNICPAGYYCPADSTFEIPCPAGTFNPVTGGMSVDACLVCLSGRYCPLSSSTPRFCPNGTFINSTGAESIDSCGPCPVNYFCPVNNPVPQACPANTFSLAGSNSLLSCRCVAGYRCSYTKTITATVTLYTSVTHFENDVGSVRTSFVNAVAAAAQVPTDRVSIVGIAPRTGNRRLLSISGKTSLHNSIVVRAKVQDATHIHELEHHISMHFRRAMTESDAVGHLLRYDLKSIVQTHAVNVVAE